MTSQNARPGPDEYAPFFAGYVARVPEGDILQILEEQCGVVQNLLRPLSRERLLARPTPEDWNILEVLGHITDGVLFPVLVSPGVVTSRPSQLLECQLFCS